MPIRILCVDDHPVFRKGITAIIASEADMTLIAEASSGEQAIKLFRQHHPDVTLMDLRLPGMSGIDAMIAIRGEYPAARIIILSTFEGDAEVQRALKAGARAYILKTMPPEEMVQTIRQVHAGKKHVPRRLPRIWPSIMRKTPSVPEKWRFFSRSRTVRRIVPSQTSFAFPNIR